MVWVMGFNATFKNISAISWWSVLLVKETGVPGEKHRSVTSNSQALGSRICFSSILSIKCVSTTYMNPFDMLRYEINAFMNYAPFS